MTNRFHPVVIALFVLAVIHVIYTFWGIVGFYTATDNETKFLYSRFSILMSPFNHWLITFSILSGAALVQAISDYNNYLYERLRPKISTTILMWIAVPMLLLSIGEIAWLFFFELSARAQIRINGPDSFANMGLMGQLFPYSLTGYTRSFSYALVSFFLFLLSKQLERLHLDINEESYYQKATSSRVNTAEFEDTTNA